MRLPSLIRPRPSSSSLGLTASVIEPAGRGMKFLLRVKRYLVSAAILKGDGTMFLIMKSLQA
jgi:hypothetical protein